MLYGPEIKRTPAAGGFDIGYLFEESDVVVWPENWKAVQLFSSLGTQWRMGFSGPTGLDYNVLFRLLDEEGISGAERREVFEDVQVLEVQALKTMSERNG